MKNIFLLFVVVVLSWSCEKEVDEGCGKHNLDQPIEVSFRLEAVVTQGGEPLVGETIEYDYTKHRCDGTITPINGTVITNSNGAGIGSYQAYFSYNNPDDFVVLTATCLGEIQTKTYNYNSSMNGTTQVAYLEFNFR